MSITPAQLGLVLITMADSVAKRDGQRGADFAHYSLKFALIAGAEKCIEIADKETRERANFDGHRREPGW